jgi:L-aspartate oxidase
MFEDGIHLINAESRNVTHISKIIIESALKRKESRGLHYMSDHPKKNQDFVEDTITQLTDNDRN